MEKNQKRNLLAIKHQVRGDKSNLETGMFKILP